MGVSISAPAGPIVSSVNWVGQILLGSVATGIAVISVAAVGVAILTGRASRRRAASTVAGCFIIFGASAIAHGLTEPFDDAAMPASDSQASLAPIAPLQGLGVYDPYAGAGLVARPTSKESLRDRTPGGATPSAPPQNSRLDVPPVIR